MKKYISCLAFLLLAGFSIFAQRSEQITKIIESEKVTFAQVSYLPALYTNLISDEESETAISDNAFQALKNEGYFSNDINADSEITLGQISCLYAKALNLKGGLFYSLFHSERYAFKELKARGVLPNESDPNMKLSGREAIDIFNTCLTIIGENE